LAGAQLTLLSALGAAGGTTNRQHFFHGYRHGYIMPGCPLEGWSILTNKFMPEGRLYQWKANSSNRSD
jgi:hypothetical protein